MAHVCSRSGGFPAWIGVVFGFSLLGTCLVVVSSWWILVWVGLVLNLIGVVPILTNTKTSLGSEAAMKYFLLQSLGASVILMMVLLGPMVPKSIVSLGMVSAVVLKLGLFPFFWVPQVFSSVSWPGILLLATWQKLGPLAVLFVGGEMFMSGPVVMVSLVSMVFGSVGAWGATNLKELIAYSSINQTSWLVLLSALSFQGLMVYIFVYFVQMGLLVFLIISVSPNQMNYFPYISDNSGSVSLMLCVVFLSMGGVPPFFGFIPKLVLLGMLMPNVSMILMVGVVIVSSLIITGVYLSIALNFFPHTMWGWGQSYSTLSLVVALMVLLILFLGPIMLVVF